MAEFKIIGKLLKLKGMKVTGVSFHRDHVARISVRPYKNGCCCVSGPRTAYLREARGARYRLTDEGDVPGQQRFDVVDGVCRRQV